MEQAKKTVLISGSSRGIGADIARLFAENGHRVAIQYHQNRAAAEALREELAGKGLSVMTIGGDVGNPVDAEQMVQDVRERYGFINVLINNAGVALPQKLMTDCTEAEWDEVFRVNVKGMFLLSRRVIPDMVSHKSGSIVNVSSQWGVTGGSCEVPYSASKAAVIGFTKALAKELAPSGIRVNCIAPGFIMTDMNAALSREDVAAIVEETPLMRPGTGRDVANASYYLAMETASFLTGQVLSVDGGRCI